MHQRTWLYTYVQVAVRILWTFFTVNLLCVFLGSHRQDFLNWDGEFCLFGPNCVSLFHIYCAICTIVMLRWILRCFHEVAHARPITFLPCFTHWCKMLALLTASSDLEAAPMCNLEGQEKTVGQKISDWEWKKQKTCGIVKCMASHKKQRKVIFNPLESGQTTGLWVRGRICL